MVGAVDGLERRDCDRHGLRSKPTRAILLCPWGKTLYGTFLCLLVLANSSEFQLYLKRTAISWHLWKRVGVIAYPTY